MAWGDAGNLLGRTVAGRYELLSVLGRGGMATVYKASQPTLDRFVAVKVIAPGLADDLRFVERFRREARMVARLRHPNILTVHDFGEDGGLLYLVTEYVEGGTLRDHAAFRSSPDRALDAIGQVGAALDYAHARGVVHRDVKPGNVFMDGERAVLADFGIAKAAGGEGLTQPFTAIGTPEYIAPEQALGQPIDGRADLYALGVMLYELVAGRPPFLLEGPADTPVALTLRKLNQPPPSPRQFNPTIAPTLEAVLLRSLDTRPDYRYPTAAGLVAAARAAVAGAGPRGTAATPFYTGPTTQIAAAPAASPPTLPPTPPPPPTGGARWPRVLIPALLALVVALGVAAVALGRPLLDARSSGNAPRAANAAFLAGTATPTATPAPSATGAPPSPTATATPLPTATANVVATQTRTAELGVLATLAAPAATATPAPTATATPVPPTPTPIPPTPTSTPLPAPTATPTPSRAPPPDTNAVVVPPSGEILYASDKAGRWALYDLRTDGSAERRLTDLTSDNYNGVWSPDGRSIAFVSERDGNPEIYVMDASGANQRRLTRNPATDNAPTWSPDGQSIAFVSNRDSGAGAIYVMDRDGGNVRRLVNAPAGWPSWSRGGTIVFTRAIGGDRLTLFGTTLDASGVWQLVATPGSDDDAPAWSPDGARLAFSSGPQQTDRQVVVADADGGNPRALSARGADSSNPVWSPDGQWLAYASNASGTLQIYLVRADGGGLRVITAGAGKKWYLSWHP
ncbi:MAG TPA: protein kinase [Thermomicrobiales bacterium]|nr:protein kinase [Thermomicrobiales bacterium]